MTSLAERVKLLMLSFTQENVGIALGISLDIEINGVVPWREGEFEANAEATATIDAML